MSPIDDSLRRGAALPLRMGRAAVGALPGGEQVVDALERLEHVIADGVADRVVEILAEPAAPGGLASQRPAADPLSALLERGHAQPRTDARQEAAARVVAHLVPDEAKLIASLAAHPAAVVHVEAVYGVRRHRRERLLHTQTTLAQDAGLRARELVVSYLVHLMDLGVIEAGPHDGQLAIDYELIEASHDVRTLVEHLEHARGVRPAVLRHTLRLSALGRLLWQLHLDGEEARR